MLPLISIFSNGVNIRYMDIMSEKEQKETLIKLDEHQFRHLLTAFGSISREIGSIAGKLEKLETKFTALEGELKLIRMEISSLKKPL